jgi:F0F1-type ATP synthase assembly protein I
MLMVLINIAIVIIVGAILFYLIDKYVRDGRLGNLLKILVGLICLAAIPQRLLPMLGVGWL